MIRDLCSEEATRKEAATLAAQVRPGTVVALHGPLGAGKSLFARAMMRALGVRDEAMPSPTFAIIQEYEGEGCRIAHMDWYRLADAEELEMIGVREYMQPPWICLIEWPERAPELLPPNALHVTLEYLPSAPNHRRVCITTGTGQRVI